MSDKIFTIDRGLDLITVHYSGVADYVTADELSLPVIQWLLNRAYAYGRRDERYELLDDLADG